MLPIDVYKNIRKLVLDLFIYSEIWKVKCALFMIFHVQVYLDVDHQCDLWSLYYLKNDKTNEIDIWNRDSSNALDVQ